MLDSITLFTIIFYSSLSLPILGVFLLSKYHSIEKEKLFLLYFGGAFIFFIFLLIAFRPIGYLGFTDTQMYIIWFNNSKTDDIIETKDLGFGLFTYLFAKIGSLRFFFIGCALLSFGTLFWISRYVTKRYWFLFFLGVMVSLYFWNHQVFTMRQGIASLLFITALFQRKLFFKFLFFLLAVSFHKSFLLPVFCYFIVIAYNKTNFYITLWLLSIPISYFFGNRLTELFSENLFPGIKYYLPENISVRNFSEFRWDVVIYSAIFIVFPYYYKFSDHKYKIIFHLYLLINAFTILLIWSTEGFIHRFVYLSWFLTPFLVYYPLFKQKNLFNFAQYFKILLLFYLLVLSYVGLKIYNQGFRFIPKVEEVATNNQVSINTYIDK